MAYTTLAYSVFTTPMDAYAAPTNDIDYSCHINHGTYSTNHMGSISHHITPLVINSLGGRHTHKHANTILRTETIIRNQVLKPVHAWFKNAAM